MVAGLQWSADESTLIGCQRDPNEIECNKWSKLRMPDSHA